jgi:hypothetical protein
MLLGVVAMYAGKPITYDGAAGKIANLTGMDYLLDREYRKGWEL